MNLVRGESPLGVRVNRRGLAWRKKPVNQLQTAPPFVLRTRKSTDTTFILFAGCAQRIDNPKGQRNAQPHLQHPVVCGVGWPKRRSETIFAVVRIGNPIEVGANPMWQLVAGNLDSETVPDLTQTLFQQSVAAKTFCQGPSGSTFLGQTIFLDK
jgi:hypothetical protein